MAHTGIFATSAQALFKAGANHADITESDMNSLHKQAEHTINVSSRTNWDALYPNISISAQGILTNTSAALVGLDIISYDMTDYNSRYEAETMMDVLRDQALRGIQLLKDNKQKDFIK